MEKNHHPTSVSQNVVPDIDWTMKSYYFYDEVKNEAPKFLGVSLTVHGVALLALIFITIPLLEKPEVETITVEISEVPHFLSKNQSRDLPAESQQEVTKTIEQVQKNDVVIPIKKIAAQHNTIPQEKILNKPVPHVVSQVKALPSTLEDIQTQDLDTALNTSKPSSISPQLFNQDLDNDLRVVQQKHKNSLAQEKRKLMQQLNAEQEATNQRLSALEQSNLAKHRQMAAANAKRREADQQALSDLEAQEGAAAAEAAQKNAQLMAAQEQEQQSNAARNAAAQEAALNEAAQKRKQQLADLAAREAARNASGRAGGIRDLSELKQKPGNPRPQYESQERLAGQQGTVIFLAYIDKDGSIGKIKTTQQTAFTNLNQKSFEAVKKWKFYPGQEGWVEIPFSWGLKGDAQEMPSLLRRSVSRK